MSLEPVLAGACAPCEAFIVAIDGAGNASDPLVAIEFDADADGDGFPALSCGGGDCDDTASAVNPGADETCNGVDDDCNGVDDDLPDAPLAAVQEGVCAGQLKVCDGSGGWLEPDYTAIAAYEATEVSCDGLDNDCSGQADDLASAPPADLQDGVCAGQAKICDGSGGWIEPDYTAIGTYEATELSCDGLDNDCSGQADDLAGAPDADEQDGVCAGAKKVCDGSGGWIEPNYADIVDYESVEASCDGLNNDCDAGTDEALSPPPAAEQRGVCAGAEKVCDGTGGWIEPNYASLADYEAVEASCDGKDNDCGGAADDILDPPLADKQAGVCTGAVRWCDGTAFPVRLWRRSRMESARAPAWSATVSRTGSSPI